MATPLTPGHVVTQSEQCFGGVQLAISIDRNVKLNWNCAKCGCNNMGNSRSCGLCGELNQKYAIKPQHTHKKERIRLLTTKDIFKRLKAQFPQFNKYKTVKTKRRKAQSTHKNRIEHLIDNLNLSLPNLNQSQNDPSDIQHDTISFIDSVFGNINFSNPFGVFGETEDIAPTIISDDEDDDDEELPLPNNDKDQFDYEFGFLSLNDDLPKYNPKHVHQLSQSAPTTPPSRRRKPTIRINHKCKPLLIGVIHTPAPSKKNRLQTVLKNVENIIKYKYDGAFLINHGYSAQQLVPVIIEVHNKYPMLWLGANFMGVPDNKIFKFVKSNKLQKILKGVWCENGGITLDTDELDDIFVHNFYKSSHSVRSLSGAHDLMLVVDDNKEDIVDIRSLKQSVSNRSLLSGTGSNKSEKKRVTFGALSNSILSNNDSNSPHPSNKPNKIATVDKMKKGDSFARTRLSQIKKYKYNGLYFGGVDLKQPQCIKIPTQKSIRTRRRTYSADVGEFMKASPRASPILGPMTPKHKPYRSPRTPRTPGKKKARSRSTRASTDRASPFRITTSHSNSIKRTPKTPKNRSNSIKLVKSLSTNTPIHEDSIAIASEEDNNNNKKTKNGIIKQRKSSNLTPKWKNKKNKNKNKNKNKIYSMTDSEVAVDDDDDDDVLRAMNDALCPRTNIAVAKSLEMANTDSTDYNRKEIEHSLSMPHDAYELGRESRSSSPHSFASDDTGDAYSIYSQNSGRSDTWSEFGSFHETLDDYFEALHQLGRFASGGYMHVITTSGKGKNIDIKLKALSEACSKKCLLAVASGVRFENIETFLPHVDILMVSTCISQDFHLFDPRKMSKFKRLIDDYYNNK